MPRFAVLTHDHPFPHWDFLLEEGDRLRTWRIRESPSSPGPLPAEPLPHHRLHYLDYEGPVGGDRGQVKRWDAGHYTVEEWAADRVVVRLKGRLLDGRAVLEAGEAANRWTFRVEQV